MVGRQALNLSVSTVSHVTFTSFVKCRGPVMVFAGSLLVWHLIEVDLSLCTTYLLSFPLSSFAATSLFGSFSLKAVASVDLSSSHYPSCEQTEVRGRLVDARMVIIMRPINLHEVIGDKIQRRLSFLPTSLFFGPFILSEAVIWSDC